MSNKEKAKDFFAFTRREQSGLIVLFGIIVALIVYFGIKRYYHQPQSYDFSSFQNEIDAFYQQEYQDSVDRLASKYAIEKSGTKKYVDKKPKKKIVGFLFNPNVISKDQWVDLGLSPKQAGSIINYRNKGGQFRIKSDLAKMYTISDSKYKELYPWIDLPEKKENKFTDHHQPEVNLDSSTIEKKDTIYNSANFRKNNNFKELEFKSINLNTADTTQLKSIRGIGSFYARKIIEYREELGGYISFEQLNEIWKMREETMLAMEPYVFINIEEIQKIDINKIQLEELKKHPYVSWGNAKALVNYRNQHGGYKTKEDLQKILILSENDYLKIKPYIIIK